MRRRDSHDGRGQGGTPLPVFLFPSQMVFYSEQRRSHRALLTLYNPYNFTISFKMLCTAPSLYRVVEAEGRVQSQSCVDLVVRHLDVSPHNWGRRDRFRMEVRGGGQVGQREIWAELRGGEGEGEVRGGGRGAEDRRTGGLQSALPTLTPLIVPTNTHLRLPTCTAVPPVSRRLVCVLLALLCVTVLMLPLHVDSSSVVPRCLHVSTNQKLACAYALGLLTVVFLR